MTETCRMYPHLVSLPPIIMWTGLQKTFWKLWNGKCPWTAEESNSGCWIVQTPKLIIAGSQRHWRMITNRCWKYSLVCLTTSAQVIIQKWRHKNLGYSPLLPEFIFHKFSMNNYHVEYFNVNNRTVCRICHTPFQHWVICRVYRWQLHNWST